MNEPEDPKTAPDPPGTAPSSSDIGYRRPPVATRFKKGVSGNPRGRPRKRRKTAPSPTPSVQDFVLMEAYRPITIRENNEPVTLPMIQAVVRSLGVAAVKGSHRAQIAITGMVKEIEEGLLDDKRALMNAILEYKHGWREVFEQCDRDGEPRPEPVPHPDDVRVDGRTGEVIYNGPFDDAEKAAWDKFYARKRESLEEIEFHRKYKKRHKQTSGHIDVMIEQDQRMVDLVDRTFPDEKTRRQADFNIHEWRERQKRLQEIRVRWRRPIPSKSEI
jgi:hypothetical protein